jgi:hypothetical protein
MSRDAEYVMKNNINIKLFAILFATFFIFNSAVYAKSDVSGICEGTNITCDNKSCPNGIDENKAGFAAELSKFLEKWDSSEYCQHQNAICSKNYSDFISQSSYAYIGYNSSYIEGGDCATGCDNCYISYCKEIVSNKCSKANTDKCSNFSKKISDYYGDFHGATYSNCYFNYVDNYSYLTDENTYCNNFKTYLQKHTGYSISTTQNCSKDFYDAHKNNAAYSCYTGQNEDKSTKYCCIADDAIFYSCADDYCHGSNGFNPNEYATACSSVSAGATVLQSNTYSPSTSDESNTKSLISPFGTMSCSDIADLLSFFNGLYRTIIIAAFIILAIMTMSDYMSVVTSGDKTDDKMKNAQKHFTIRITVLVILTLIPFIVNIFLRVFTNMGSICSIS